MGWIGPVLQFAGSAVGAYGNYSAGEKQADAYGDIAAMFLGARDEVADMADPFRHKRQKYVGQLDDILSGRRDISTTAGYQFNKDEQLKAVERAASARGYNRSGNVMTALQNRSAGLASQEYDKIINRLMTLSGANVNPAQASQAVTDLYKSAAYAMGGAAQSRAAGTSSAGGMLGGGLSGIGDILGN